IFYEINEAFVKKHHNVRISRFLNNFFNDPPFLGCASWIVRVANEKSRCTSCHILKEHLRVEFKVFQSHSMYWISSLEKGCIFILAECWLRDNRIAAVLYEGSGE